MGVSLVEIEYAEVNRSLQAVLVARLILLILSRRVKENVSLSPIELMRAGRPFYYFIFH